VIGASVDPLQTQGQFLMRMGIAERLQRVIDLPQTTEEQADKLFEAFKVLVGQAPGQMGCKFKTICIANDKLMEKIEGFKN
jgi:SAM-dependent MidA family methyltransferase